MHNNDEIPKVDKFNYLNSLLTLTDYNYDSVSMLKERFGNPQQFISAMVFDKIMIHFRGLKALGITSEQYGSLLIPVIMTKFCSEICLQIAQETGREAWRIEPLLVIIKTEVEAREANRTIAKESTTAHSKFLSHK